jgi:hypothetical protein
MPDAKDLRFVRLRNTAEDLVGYVTHKEGYLTIEQPLRVEIETLFDEGRQILAMQEYLPQSIVMIKEIDILADEVMFTTPVREDFVEQYEYVSDFFYNNKSTLRDPPTKKKKKKGVEDTDNVVSIMEAMVNKKDKPIH